MSTDYPVQQLNPTTINQIAAGEVIEGPHSVVKELIENAIDAGATQIRVDLALGGKALIRVSDNGRGIHPRDLPNVGKPHSTSKIQKLADLEQIISFGFRGEALCSMIAVADVTIETRHQSQESGGKVKWTSGVCSDVQTWMRTCGTTISIERLFTHTPVRRKFLGSDKAESQKILRVIERTALSRPQLSIECFMGDKEVLRLPAVSREKRVQQILGSDLSKSFIPVEWKDDGICIEGFLAPPERAMRRASAQYLFLNDRYFQSPVLTKALCRAYEGLPSGHYPPAVLYITFPQAWVDINVHPAKREVRFADDSLIFTSVKHAVQKALSSILALPVNFEAHTKIESTQNTLQFTFQPTVDISFEGRLVDVNSDDPIHPSDASTVQQISNSTVETLKDVSDVPSEKSASESLTVPKIVVWPQNHWTDKSEVQLQETLALGQAQSEFAAPDLSLMQLHKRFLLVEVRGGLMVVCQRAAHERVLYETALKALREEKSLPSQQLLFPELVELGPSAAQLLEHSFAVLAQVGFDISAFGPGTFQIRGVPQDCAPGDGPSVVKDLLHDLEEERGELRSKMALAYARRMAIPVEKELAPAERAHLIHRLFSTQNPSTSPWGKPVFLRFSLDDLERRLQIRP